MKQINYFAKNLGVAVRTVGYDQGGKVVFSTETTDIKKNADIDPDRFVFKGLTGEKVYRKRVGGRRGEAYSA